MSADTKILSGTLTREQAVAVFDKLQAIDGLTDEFIHAVAVEVQMISDHENELAEAFEAFTDPAHPEFDAGFTRDMMQRFPGWFTDEHRTRLKGYLHFH